MPPDLRKRVVHAVGRAFVLDHVDQVEWSDKVIEETERLRSHRGNVEPSGDTWAATSWLRTPDGPCGHLKRLREAGSSDCEQTGIATATLSATATGGIEKNEA
ncbi:hypothetical protein [Methylobacterium sp. Leaf86]|uniref:hypothetical protein n=1 Tax=Methylobacterium sp. Leaf86 TaxID=1736242 RepID=UPI0012E8DF8E|nr:hypothetical protein [Methylobacterium sp. Leaf86]